MVIFDGPSIFSSFCCNFRRQKINRWKLFWQREKRLISYSVAFLIRTMVYKFGKKNQISTKFDGIDGSGFCNLTIFCRIQLTWLRNHQKLARNQIRRWPTFFYPTEFVKRGWDPQHKIPSQKNKTWNFPVSCGCLKQLLCKQQLCASKKNLRHRMSIQWFFLYFAIKPSHITHYIIATNLTEPKITQIRRWDWKPIAISSRRRPHPPLIIILQDRQRRLC